ncbi:hypothetical protein NJF44_07100 [Pseudomonas guariconensis]|uniref:DUF6555 family protein n=1 Tax=Pseudomonas TaxID=286 RepID=UPI001CE48F4F|nr:MULTISPECIES: DUF6555 family protein [Pseudomonas]MCO7639402.1 hypothetical protein [Pseudomonas sp. S 311-6]MCO7515132.1 hypothetical protein [Pseudomonas putida]MCO7565106.1 hypothetical protein [Pseudomonas mosselii]MCO7593795.1 hypothetical protein [Pseudomonas guariconensis]MCO7605009.1 hypothetical protein [Pseudomonas guariconensis]
MPTPQLYIIDYRLHGEQRSFIIRLERMDNAEAWHWASCDAGVGIIPKFGRERIRKVSRPMAERYGITEVSWRLSGSGAQFVPKSGPGVAAALPGDSPLPGEGEAAVIA